MKTEADFKEGEVVIFANMNNTRNYTGEIDYSQGEEEEGYIRVRQVFSETSDIGNCMYIPASHIYEAASDD